MTASEPTIDATTERATDCSRSPALSAVTESSSRARSHIAQVSGSTSASVGSRRASRPPISVVSEISGPKARVKSGSRSSPDHGAVISLSVVARATRAAQRRRASRSR